MESKNLFDKDLIIVPINDYIKNMTTTDINTYIPIENFIRVRGETVYTCSHNVVATLYDENKNFIKNGLLEDFINSTEEEIPNGYFFRANMAYGTPKNRKERRK